MTMVSSYETQEETGGGGGDILQFRTPRLY